MVFYVLFEKQRAWLIKNGFEMECQICKKPCLNGESVVTPKVRLTYHSRKIQSLPKRIFHKDCYLTSVTKNQTMCGSCKRRVNAKITWGKDGQILNTTCLYCDGPVKFHYSVIIQSIKEGLKTNCLIPTHAQTLTEMDV